MSDETVLCLLKPDCVKAGNVGKVLTELEKMGLSLVEMRVMEVPEEQAEKFYADRFPNKDAAIPHVEHLLSGPSVAVVLRGDGAASVLTALLSDEDPKAARKGSLRKKFGRTVVANALHGSKDAISAKKEIGIFFDGWTG